MRTEKRTSGRRPAIPPGLFGTLVGLRAEGLGHRAIANHLMGLGVMVSKSSVCRAVNSQGCYKGSRVRSGGTEGGG